MSVSVIGLITIALGGIAFFHSTRMALTVMCCFALLGAASALALGPANMTPGFVASGFFALAVIMRPRAFAYASLSMVRGRAGLVIILLCAWAIISGLFLPRLFAGQIYTFPMTSLARRFIEVPVYPSSSNINQIVYFLLGAITFFLVSSFARTEKSIENVAWAVIFASIANLVLVFLDTFTFAIGQSNLLSFIRNADYAQAYSHTVMGIKRVTGGFPEASAFTAVGAPLFAFNFRLWRGGVMTKYTGPVAALSLLALIFTFSSTAYVSVLVYLSFAYSNVFVDMQKKGASNKKAGANRRLLVMLLPIGALGVAVALAVRPDLLAPVTEAFDTTVSSKLQSKSGVVRMSWNTSGWNAFLDSYGLGVGLGSARTSSFVVAVLANLGIIGAILFGLLFFQLFSDQTRQAGFVSYETRQIVAAARAGCFTVFVAGCLSATAVDLGTFFYVFAGLICASAFYRSPAVTRVPARAQQVPA